MTTIREIRADEVGVVTDLYLELCRSLSERDADWGVPAREPIRRWIRRTTETDEAVCLVPEIEEEIAGYLLASVSRHPAMPGVTGDLEELRPARARRGCAEAEARRSRHRLGASAGRGGDRHQGRARGALDRKGARVLGLARVRERHDRGHALLL